MRQEIKDAWNNDINRLKGGAFDNVLQDFFIGEDYNKSYQDLMRQYVQDANQELDLKSNDAILNAYSNTNPYKTDYSGADFGGTSDGGWQLLGKSLQGGNIISAAVNAITSLPGSLSRKMAGDARADWANSMGSQMNDIYKNKLNLAANNLSDKTLKNQISNVYNYAFGGALAGNGADFSNGVTTVNNGGTHEQNPVGGVLQGIAQDGQPNLVEEGEAIWNDYVFSNRLKVPKSIMKELKLGRKSITFAEAVKKIQKNSKERPNDPIEQRTLGSILGQLEQVQEQLRMKEEMLAQYNQGGHLGYNGLNLNRPPKGLYDENALMYQEEEPNYVNPFDDYYLENYGISGESYNLPLSNKSASAIPSTTSLTPTTTPVTTSTVTPTTATTPTTVTDPGDVTGTSADIIGSGNNKKPRPDLPEWGPEIYLEDVPLLRDAVTLGLDAIGKTNRPNYKYANAYDKAGKQARKLLNPALVKYDKVHMPYRPFDRLLYLNAINQSAAADRRAIANTAGGNAGTAIAGLLASGNKALNSIGEGLLKGEMYNYEQRKAIAEQELKNSVYDLDAKKTNAAAINAMRMEQAKNLIDTAWKSNLLRLDEDRTSHQNRYTNINTAAEDFYNKGRDMRNAYTTNALINSGAFGILNDYMADTAYMTPAQRKKYMEEYKKWREERAKEEGENG